MTMWDSGKRVTGTFCLKGPEGASHKVYLSPFSIFVHECEHGVEECAMRRPQHVASKAWWN